MTERDLQSPLKSLAEARFLAPDPQRLKLHKHRLLAEVNRSEFARQKSRLTGGESLHLNYLKTIRSFMMHQYALALAIFLLIVVLPTSYIAQAAVPGDALWPVKITIEKAEVAVAFNSEQESRIHIRHVEKRLWELQSVMAKQEDVQKKTQNVTQVIRRLEKDITSAHNSLKITEEAIKESKPNAVIALARDLNEQTNAVVAALEQNKAILVDAIEATSFTEGASDDEAALHASSTMDTSASEEALSASTTPESTAATTTASAPEDAMPIKDVAAMIDEVALVNEYISYATIETMIDMMGRTPSVGPEIVTLLRERTEEQRRLVQTIHETTPLINEDFLLHESQVTKLTAEAENLLKRVDDYIYLGYLADALKKLNQAKDIISTSVELLDEVERNGGMKELIDGTSNETVIENLGVPAVSIQSIENTTSTQADAALPPTQ